MESTLKCIGVLTSGGDAPGMNAAVRSVVRTAIYNGIRVIGIRRGYNGLINGDIFEMNLRSVSDIIHCGGTVLYTARCDEFKTDAGLTKARNTCLEAGIDGVVVIGGDGSFRGARDLTKYGIPCIALPGTIDNDIACSEYTIGYDTAVNTAMQMIDKLRDTTQSHDRCTVVEVMGRHAGHIALKTAVACGASGVIVPEKEFVLDKLIEKMKRSQRTGKQHFIVIVAEGHGKVDELAREIERLTHIETRATVLGHVQRGGSPTVRDRVVASEMGHYAVELLLKGSSNRVVAMQGGKIVDFDIDEALAMTKTLDMELYKISSQISI